jgi:hypothetical protein
MITLFDKLLEMLLLRKIVRNDTVNFASWAGMGEN